MYTLPEYNILYEVLLGLNIFLKTFASLKIKFLTTHQILSIYPQYNRQNISLKCIVNVNCTFILEKKNRVRQIDIEWFP